MQYSEGQSARGILLDRDLLHGLHNIVSAEAFDLLALMRGADGNDGRASSHSRFDAGRRVLENDGTLGVNAKIFGGQEEGVGEGFAPLETGVVGGHANVRNGDPGEVSEELFEKRYSLTPYA